MLLTNCDRPDDPPLIALAESDQMPGINRWIFLLSLPMLVCGVNREVRGGDKYPVTRPPAELKLDPFYKKYASASGYPVVASGRVSDHALKEAAYLVDLMLAKRPDVRKAMIDSGSRLIVIGHNEFTSQIPEYAHLKPKSFWDARARGLGGSREDPVCSCAEENVLGYKGDPYDTECIVIHEFAHNIHLRGLVRIDKTFDARLKQAYDRAMARGLWKNKYASTNRNEYWAEGVQSWFNNNRPPDHDHNHVDTRKELQEYDAGLAKLCEEVFGDTKLVYSKPVTRLKDHLADYDPDLAPTFRWPERLAAVRAEIKAKARNRGQGKPSAGRDPKTGFIMHAPVKLQGFTLQFDKRLLAGPNKAVGDEVKRMIDGKLFDITLLVPPSRLKHLREVPIWVDLDHPLKNCQYHPGAKWLRDHGHDPKMVKAVHVPDARRLINLVRSNDQPAVMLHELAHAYHDRVLGFGYGPIRQAWDKIVASKKYEKVLHIRGRQVRHYALTNHKEFFAEMTEAFFDTNDFYPFVRAELREFEPEVFALLKAVWSEGEPPKPPKK